MNGDDTRNDDSVRIGNRPIALYYPQVSSMNGDDTRNDDSVRIGNRPIKNNNSVEDYKEHTGGNIGNAINITETRNDTNVVRSSNNEPIANNSSIRDVRDITCSTAATMSGVTFGNTTTLYHPGEEYYDDDAITTTERGRKINAQDIQNIFVSYLVVTDLFSFAV